MRHGPSTSWTKAMENSVVLCQLQSKSHRMTSVDKEEGEGVSEVLALDYERREVIGNKCNRLSKMG